MERDLIVQILGAAKEVFDYFGDGFAEKVYEEAMEIELGLRGLHTERNFPIHVFYKEHIMDASYVPDLVVNNRVILELKTLKNIRTLDDSQLQHYLKIANLPVALVINFGTMLETRMQIREVSGPPTPGEPVEPGTKARNPETI